MSQRCEHVETGRACLLSGDPDLAADFFVIAYRTEIARIVSEIRVSACPRLQLVKPWSYRDEWAGWAALSLHHRARREGLDRVELPEDVAPGSEAFMAHGMWWLDRYQNSGAGVRTLMPDAFLHVHTRLGRSRIVRALLPNLIEALRLLGRMPEAIRHEIELEVFQEAG